MAACLLGLPLITLAITSCFVISFVEAGLRIQGRAHFCALPRRLSIAEQRGGCCTQALHACIGEMLRPVSAKTRSVVLVFRKCSKKLGGGFGKKGSKSQTKETAQIGWRRARAKGRPAYPRDRMSEALLQRCRVVMDVARPENWLIVPAQTEAEAVLEKTGLPVISRG
jgi:hypothetical protein